MKRINKVRRVNTVHLLLSAFILVFAGCAPPPAANDLQQRIDQLLQIQQQQAKQLENLQQQLARLQNRQPSSEPVNEAQPATELSIPTVPVTTETEPTIEEPSAAEIAQLSQAASLYLEAFAAIATGQMEKAEAGFRAFIERYPEHEYTGNASYWMAEALFAQQKPRRAETVLLGVIDNPQQQNKAPAAMARLVQYYRESGAQDNARAMLQMLSSHYPDSSELKRLMRATESR